MSGCLGPFTHRHRIHPRHCKHTHPIEPEAAHSALVKGANGRRVYDKHLASSYDIVEGEGHHAFKPTPVASPGTANSDSDERGDSKRSGNRGSDTADLSNKQFVRKSQQYVAADKAYYDYVNKSATAGAPSYYTLAIQATANASKDGGADSGGASLSSAVLPSGASRGRSHTDLMRGTSVELPAAVSRKKAMPYYDPSSAGTYACLPLICEWVCISAAWCTQLSTRVHAPGPISICQSSLVYVLCCIVRVCVAHVNL